MNKAVMRKDSKGLPLQIDDPVKVTERTSMFADQTGIIKNMVRDKLFLWSDKFLSQSNGIFVESCKNVRIQGHDIITKQQARPDHIGSRGPINQNRIQRDKLINKKVIIIRG